MVFLTTNIPTLQILCFNIRYLSGQVCPLSEDHVSLTALLRWPKKWLIMTCDSDTYSGSPFPFFSLPVCQREAKGMFREGGGACLFISSQFILRGLWRSQGHFWLNGTLPGPKGHVLFISLQQGREGEGERGAGGKAGVKINKSASCCSHSCYIITTEQFSSMSCSAQCNILSDVTLYSEAHWRLSFVKRDRNAAAPWNPSF